MHAYRGWFIDQKILMAMCKMIAKYFRQPNSLMVREDDCEVPSVGFDPFGKIRMLCFRVLGVYFVLVVACNFVCVELAYPAGTTHYSRIKCSLCP